MRVKTIAAAAGAAAAVLLSTPPALADGIDIDLRPGNAMPGETVTVTGECGRPGDRGMRLVSRALSAEPAELGSGGWFSVPATVRRVQPESYTVTVVCEPSTTSATRRFRVERGFHEHGRQEHGRQEHGRAAYPHGGAGTGGGGTAQGGDRPSMDPALVLGVLIAGGIGVALVRGRSRGRV